ncbi:hypothetical protein [Luteibacter sp.]|uniref:hypothetical protein n=1 Tax=Luteibacter sp. TaxID=1886636 RepID=UPI003F7E99E3
MDMLPPSPAPAAVHGMTREAAAASAELLRLSAAHAALARLDESAPRLPDPAPATFDTFLSDHAAWRSMAQAQLAPVVAEILRGEAALRSEDGTLSPNATRLAGRVADRLAGNVGVGLSLQEVWAGPHVVAGAVAATADDTPGLHLLFLPGQGWEALASVDETTDAVRHYVSGCIQSGSVAGMHVDACADAFDGAEVSLRAASADAAGAWTTHLFDTHLARIRQVWDDYQLDRDLPGAQATFNDRLLGHARLASVLDVPALLRAREARLLAQATDERLARVPPPVARDWRAATVSYARLAADTAVLRTAWGVEPPMGMVDFTSNELDGRLAALGIGDASAMLSVDVTHDPAKGSYEHLKQLLVGPNTIRQTLHALAWRGLTIMDAVQLSTVRHDGSAMAAHLAQADLVAVVRDARVAPRYREHLESQLRTGPAGRLAKLTAIELTAARMRADAAQARLSYYLADEPRSFLEDHAERGFRWVEAMLDHRAPAGRKLIDGHEVVARQLTYKDIPLRDVVVIGARDARSVPRVVVYTPDAPDGAAFREFADRQAMARAFLYAPAFREYLLDRLPAAFATQDPNGVTRRFKGDRLAHWVLGSPADAAYTLTEEPFDEREVSGDFIDAGYDAMVDQRIHDTHHVESGAKEHWTFSPIGTHPVTGLATDLALSTLSAPARLRSALDRFYDGVKSGDATDAYLAFTDAWVTGLDLAGPLWAAGSGRAPLLRHARGAAPQPAQARLDLRGPRFESRYAARSVAANELPDSEGFHIVQGRRHVSQDGRLYPVRFDDYNHVWRLERPQGSLDATFTGPAVQRIGGEWTYARGVGLPGGAGRGLRERLRRALNLGGREADHAAAPAEPAVPAAAEPVAAPRPSLPPALEPIRDEVEAIIRDNPSATFRYRLGSNESMHLRVDVPSRSAMVFDDGIASDLATLDAGQRRQFLHELETRVPDARERSLLLARRGWADGGRRVGSPGQRRWRGEDGQDPSIGSSSDPSTPPPAGDLTPRQASLWDEAVAAARLAVAAADEAVGGVGTTTIVAPHDWPESFWIYTPEAPGRAFGVSGGIEWLIQGHSRHFYDPGEFRVTTLPPGTPRARLDEALGITALERGRGDPTGHWIEVDRNYMRQAYWRGEHRMERRLLASGEYAYTLRTRRRDLTCPRRSPGRPVPSASPSPPRAFVPAPRVPVAYWGLPSHGNVPCACFPSRPSRWPSR